MAVASPNDLMMRKAKLLKEELRKMYKWLRWFMWFFMLDAVVTFGGFVYDYCTYTAGG